MTTREAHPALEHPNRTLNTSEGRPQTVSEAKLAANRENARLSTGPKTAEGKSRSSRNSFKHGLYSRQLVLDHEDPAKLDQLRADLLAEHQPANTTEEILVNELAEQYWRLLRFRACEVAAWTTLDLLPRLQRAMAAAERGFHKALTALRQLQWTVASFRHFLRKPLPSPNPRPQWHRPMNRKSLQVQWLQVQWRNRLLRPQPHQSTTPNFFTRAWRKRLASIRKGTRMSLILDRHFEAERSGKIVLKVLAPGCAPIWSWPSALCLKNIVGVVDVTQDCGCLVRFWSCVLMEAVPEKDFRPTVLSQPNILAGGA